MEKTSDPLSPYLVIGVTADSEVVLKGARTRERAEELAAEFRKYCTQYSAIRVDQTAPDVVAYLKHNGAMGTCAVARALRLAASRAKRLLDRAVKQGKVRHVPSGRFGKWEAV